MSYQTLLLEIRDNIAFLTVNRPDKLNALDPAMFAGIVEAGEALKGDPAVRVVVLSGAGRGFCAGLDLQDPALLDQSRRAGRLDDLGWVGRWVLAMAACQALASASRFELVEDVLLRPGSGLVDALGEGARLVGFAVADDLSPVVRA